jgi:peptidoglycan/LPS O-acetylase OafA/YrhL
MSGHPERPPIPPLTALRFFAAALVVIFHYDANRFARAPQFLRSWLETGYEAVTFFFVLSGFVLAYVYWRTDGQPAVANLRSFFVARFGRLFPAYYVSLLLALPFFVAPGFFSEGERPSPHPVTDAILVVAALQSWWPPSALAWNPPGWSVSVEWFMYATFPLVLAGLRRIPSGTALVGAMVLVVAVALFRVRVMGPLVEQDPETWYHFAQFFPLFHLPQFIFGVALGRVQCEGPRLAPSLAAWMFAAGTLGLMITLLDTETLPQRIRSNAVIVTFFALIIYGAAQPGHLAWRILSLRPLVWLGNISYSIYAVHQPLEFWWEWAGPLAWDVEIPLLADFLLFFAVVLGASALCYRYVEAPLRLYFKRRAERP